MIEAHLDHPGCDTVIDGRGGVAAEEHGRALPLQDLVIIRYDDRFLRSLGFDLDRSHSAAAVSPVFS